MKKPVAATRVCPVCLKELTGTGHTATDAQVNAQVAVLKHQLDHPYEAVVAAGKRKPS